MIDIGILAYHDNVHFALLFTKGKCNFCGLVLKQ